MRKGNEPHIFLPIRTLNFLRIFLQFRGLSDILIGYIRDLTLARYHIRMILRNLSKFQPNITESTFHCCDHFQMK